MYNADMINPKVTVDTADEAWLYWYDALKGMNLNQSSRDGAVIGEALNAITVINDPTRCIMTNDVRRMSIRYAVGEMLWYLSCNKSANEIGKYSKAWLNLSDDFGNVSSNYGNCIACKYGFDQLAYVVGLLKDDPDTRRAVIHIKEPSNKPSKDVNCAVSIQFMIREEKLYMTVYMRSNDLWLGFPYDVFNFANLQVYVSMVLGLQLGSYTHIAASLHLYERNVKNV